MDKTITKMKTHGYQVRTIEKTCSYCNERAKYNLETGFLFLYQRPICEKHRLEIVKRLDKGD